MLNLRKKNRRINQIRIKYLQISYFYKIYNENYCFFLNKKINIGIFIKNLNIKKILHIYYIFLK
jgi:hypothetical protein